MGNHGRRFDPRGNIVVPGLDEAVIQRPQLAGDINTRPAGLVRAGSGTPCILRQPSLKEKLRKPWTYGSRLVWRHGFSLGGSSPPSRFLKGLAPLGSNRG